MSPRIIILSTHSFLDENIFVGMQEIPLSLVERGWEVDYVSVFSSPFDLVGARRRERLKRVWWRRQDIHGYPVAKGVTEYCFRVPFPADKRILKWRWQAELMGALLPSFLSKREYDVCLFDVTPTIAILPYVKARKYVFRLNDFPRAFQARLPGHVSRMLAETMTASWVDEIWPVSRCLEDHCLAQGGDHEKTFYITNGYNDKRFALQSSPNSERRCVYVGAIEEWFDQKLLGETAKLMPDWHFDIYGPASVAWTVRSGNVKFHGPTPPSTVPALLRQYSVGLIPFKDFNNLIGTMERPLKFYEYLASGLGVASTSISSLKTGMGELASYGSTPMLFKEAILQAYTQSQDREWSSKNNLKLFTWDNIVTIMDQRLRAMLSN
ncbi:MAG: glycosyltransferase [Oscillospiraceae bacterium]|nr:glycosyltransferase [Oscillospiraceae bacterium]